MTYRERMERRAERRRQWADSRVAKRDAAWKQSHDIAHEIPLGQPILVGHHSEKAMRRLYDTIERKGFEGLRHHEMVAHHETAAAGIEHQLERSIYSGDPDAIERLQERIAELEAKRERIKAYNVTARKGKPDASMLTDDERRDLEMCLRYTPGKGAQFPAYMLSNLGADIRRNRERIDDIKRRQQRQRTAEDAGGVSVRHGDRHSWVTFAEKPDRATIDALKAAGYRYSRGTWSGLTERLPEGIA